MFILKAYLVFAPNRYIRTFNRKKQRHNEAPTKRQRRKKCSLCASVEDRCRYREKYLDIYRDASGRISRIFQSISRYGIEIECRISIFSIFHPRVSLLSTLPHNFLDPLVVPHCPLLSTSPLSKIDVVCLILYNRILCRHDLICACMPCNRTLRKI